MQSVQDGYRIERSRTGIAIRWAGLKRMAGRVLIPVLVLFPLGGCSLAFVDGPSPSPSPSGNACTTSYAAPTLDLLGVPATFVLGFGFGGFERSLEAVAPDDDDTFGNLEKASLAASGTLLVSSVYGLVQVGRCRGSRGRRGGPQLVGGGPDGLFRQTLPYGRVPARWRTGETGTGSEARGNRRQADAPGSIATSLDRLVVETFILPGATSSTVARWLPPPGPESLVVGRQ